MLLSLPWLVESVGPNQGPVSSEFTGHSTCLSLSSFLTSSSCYFPLSQHPHPPTSNCTLHAFLSHHKLCSGTRLGTRMESMTMTPVYDLLLGPRSSQHKHREGRCHRARWLLPYATLGAHTLLVNSWPGCWRSEQRLKPVPSSELLLPCNRLAHHVLGRPCKMSLS